MAKTLQDYIFVVQTDQRGVAKSAPIQYDKRFVSFLTDGANNHITGSPNRDSVQVTLDAFIFWCMDEFQERSISPALTNTLNKHICHIGHQCQMHPLHGRITATYIAHLKHKPPPELFAAYMFSNMASRGWLDGLKRCKNPNCTQFFFGRPNVKWCSKKCGSLVRVRMKRKKDRER